MDKIEPGAFYGLYESFYRQHYDNSLDVSRMDFAILRKMVGNYTTSEMMKALESNPRLAIGKTSHEEDHIHRTVKSVIKEFHNKK